MRTFGPVPRFIFRLMIASCVMGITFTAATAQSQEPKPGSESATPAASEATPVDSMTMSGLGDNEWLSPIWDVQVVWNPDDWTVENELIESRYEGIQLGSDGSTVFIEAYEGFAGSAQECLTAAEQEIAARENTREVIRLSGRPMPEIASNDVEPELFGVVADLPDGSIYRGAEYVSCRSLQPGLAVLEATWQTATVTYNDELPRVTELFASISVPDSED